jgi:hypothetical protein
LKVLCVLQGFELVHLPYDVDDVLLHLFALRLEALARG